MKRKKNRREVSRRAPLYPANGLTESGVLSTMIVLKGRFIHITDFHPDPHYIAGGSFDSGCHRTADEDIVAESLRMSSGLGISQQTNITGVGMSNKKDKKQEGAGKWGSGLSYVMLRSIG
jgi:hypothetical protein